VQSRLPAVNLTHFSNINENEVKYKIGLCHLAVHDTRSALSEVLLYPNPPVYTHPILSCNLTVLLVVLVAWCFVEFFPGTKLYHCFPLWFA
jgi:hypothetical protein